MTARSCWSHRVVEFPGQGDSPVPVTRDTAIGYQELLASEVAAGMAFVAERWPGAPRVLVGHSLGGQLSLLYAASHPGEVAAIALLAAGTIHWRAFDGVAGPGILAVTQVARMIAAVRGLFPGDRLGFGGRQPRRLISDWGRVGLTGRWEPANASADYHALLARLSVPILSATRLPHRQLPRPWWAWCHWPTSATSPSRPPGLVDMPTLRGCATPTTLWPRWLSGSDSSIRPCAKLCELRDVPWGSESNCTISTPGPTCCGNPLKLVIGKRRPPPRDQLDEWLSPFPRGV